MKKSIIIAAMAVAVITLGIITACSKENRSNEAQIGNQKQGNTLLALDKSREIIIDFAVACDNAFKTDSAAFMASCNSSDRGAFLKCIGISQEEYDQMGIILSEEILTLAEENPEMLEALPSPCTDCISNSLPRIGKETARTSGDLERVAHLDMSYCLFVCGLSCMSMGPAYPECVLACMLICLIL
ncbi:MAG: hypothetical protein SPL12_09805 [Bacteroidales bacterium]|nr:hypothetical protein [Bacteroidales bacterium]